MPKAKISAPDSSCIFRISLRIVQPRRAEWTRAKRRDIFGINVQGSVPIRKFLTSRRVVRAIRTFNLTHVNRGRNAYQASHCYSVADYMQAD
jgi:hypothetical protein